MDKIILPKCILATLLTLCSADALLRTINLFFFFFFSIPSLSSSCSLSHRFCLCILSLSCVDGNLTSKIRFFLFVLLINKLQNAELLVQLSNWWCKTKFKLSNICEHVRLKRTICQLMTTESLYLKKRLILEILPRKTTLWASITLHS